MAITQRPSYWQVESRLFIGLPLLLVSGNCRGLKRETGFEPATSTLASLSSSENKGPSRPSEGRKFKQGRQCRSVTENDGGELLQAFGGPLVGHCKLWGKPVGQPDSLHFAGRSCWDLCQNQNACRHFESRQTLQCEVPKLELTQALAVLRYYSG